MFASGERKDGGRPSWGSDAGKKMRRTGGKGDQVLLYAALAAIACALKLCQVAPGETVKEGDWPGGCPHCQEGAAVKQ